MFRVDPAKVPAIGVRARCSVCGAVISVQLAEPVQLEPASAADMVAQPAFNPVQTAPAVAASALPTPSAAAAGTSVPTTPSLPVAPAPLAPAGPGDAPSPADHDDPEPLAEVGAEASSTKLPQRPVTPSQGVETSLEPQSVQPQSAGVGRITPVPSASSGDARSPQPRLAPRRVNPYLSNDPAQKARRLARALVSDLVAYNPQKREEGLRAGTLKELFRDEIRKSWQEYVEQVGATIAESTPHFQEALNDILAGGRRIF